MRFAGKVVLVTGGAQGIGLAICQAFAREGARVVMVDIDEEAGQEAAAGGPFQFVKADVAEEDDVRRVVQTVQSQFGRLDVLVNNAGITATGTLGTRPVAEWDRVLAVNLRGPYLMAKYCAPLLVQANPGSIVNIASTRALMSEPHTEPYSASKGGLLALTHSLAVSLGPDVRVNAISPGWIDVSEWKKTTARSKPNLRPEDHRQHPAGRVGTPADIAAACLFLSAPEAGFITGANLVIDGGMTIRMIYVD
ncbi:MAG: glucose 1-dehydrogenase [Alicyclobacillaceae bacterium]|nr:glucose 1-dehydrogenase [Alicyclobacillaceae bacterium]